MLIYYNYIGDICISLSGLESDEPDMIIHIDDSFITITAGEVEEVIERGNELAISEENGKLIVDFDATTPSIDGFEMSLDTQVNEIVVMKDGEAVIDISDDGVKDKEDIADEEAAEEGNTCKIGDQYFASLKEAVATAQNGEPISIKMIADENGPGIGLFTADGDTSKDITIDFNGHSYVASSPAVGSKSTQTQALHLEMGNKVTLKNGAFTSDRNAADIKMLIQNYCDLTLDHMICDCADDASITYVCSNNFGNCLVKDSELLAHPSQVALDCWFGLGKTYDAEGVRVTAQNSKLSSKIEYGAQRAALNREGNENWFERTILTLNNCEFGRIDNSGAGANDVHNIVIDGSRFEGELPLIING